VDQLAAEKLKNAKLESKLLKTQKMLQNQYNAVFNDQFYDISDEDLSEVKVSPRQKQSLESDTVDPKMKESGYSENLFRTFKSREQATED